MSEIYRIDFGTPALLEFRGPDAVRFLNGQITQDVRRVAGGEIALPSCVTDAKGKLQFRITLTQAPNDGLWVAGLAHQAEDLEARLTRYLIADDVEVTSLTNTYKLYHFLEKMPAPPPGGIARESNRYGVAGTDWWLPTGQTIDHPLLGHDELEALRIANGIPIWGRELIAGMLPPEALLEATDISYQKGCYVGQEVISRIKSAGKVNKRLTRFVFDAQAPVIPGSLENSAGEVTSVSPLTVGEIRHALGYVKRGAVDWVYKAPDGSLWSVRAA